MVPIVNHSITKAVVAVALIVNCILLALVVSSIFVYIIVCRLFQKYMSHLSS